jgi:ferredoxin
LRKTRRVVQFGFLALVLGSVYAVGGNCERWCPFGGVEAAFTYASEGNMLCSLGTSNFFILGGVLAMTVLARRVFCGYVCPLGAIAEGLHGLGRRLRLPRIRVGARIDRLLALLKYVALAAILVLTWRAGELIFRAFDPCYALISRHGSDITYWAYVVSGAIGLASLVIMVPFCRWVCPFAAVLNPLSRFGLTRVSRDAERCTDCGLCSKNCPAAIPVSQMQAVTVARCISCLDCVDSCPENAKGIPVLSWGPPRPLGPRWPQAALIGVLLLCTTVAVTASYVFPMPSFVKSRGQRPEEISTVRLQVENLTCRGRANLFFYFLERDDMHKVRGYLKVDAWPGTGLADVDITFDPAQADADDVKRAISEPYYDAVGSLWRMSPFTIEGYDPLIVGGLSPLLN